MLCLRHDEPVGHTHRTYLHETLVDVSEITSALSSIFFTDKTYTVPALSSVTVACAERRQAEEETLCARLMAEAFMAGKNSIHPQSTHVRRVRQVKAGEGSPVTFKNCTGRFFCLFYHVMCDTRKEWWGCRAFGERPLALAHVAQSIHIACDSMR